MRTLEDLLAETRDFLQDSIAPYRHSDAELLRYYNDAVGELYRLRPDLVACLDTSVLQISAFTGTFPIDDAYFRPVAMFIAGSASLKDDEYVSSGRALGLIGAFNTALMGALHTRAS